MVAQPYPDLVVRFKPQLQHSPASSLAVYFKIFLLINIFFYD